MVLDTSYRGGVSSTDIGGAPNRSTRLVPRTTGQDGQSTVPPTRPRRVPSATTAPDPVEGLGDVSGLRFSDLSVEGVGVEVSGSR